VDSKVREDKTMSLVHSNT